PGTQIALGVIDRRRVRTRAFSLPLPWALCAMRRYQDPFARQRVEATMGMNLRIEVHALSVLSIDRRVIRPQLLGVRVDDFPIRLVLCALQFERPPRNLL